LTLLAGWLAAGGIVCARADDLSEKARQIFEKNKNAVINVQVVLKVSYSAGGRSAPANETKQEITGTVVDGTGLTVAALSACDPSELAQSMMGDGGYKVETEVIDVKLLLDDNSEVPAEIVLRDKDLDLAFIRPKTKPAAPMAAVDFSKASPVQILDQVVTINRLNRAASRAFSASLERISAVISKPRTFYVPDSTMTATALGCPAFALDGNIVGIMVLRTVNTKGASSRDPRQNMTGIILRAEDVLKGAKQAPEAKPDTEKKETADGGEKPKTDK
jgi:hypothetical protein